MSRNVKHVGKMKNNDAKVIIVFRTLPGDPNSALVVGTSNLSDLYHNAIINLVDSDQGQQVNEFGEILATRFFPDGRQMLASLHADGKLIKVSTSDVIVTPTPTQAIPLNELNVLIAEQKGVKVEDLAIGTENEPREIAKVKDLTESTTTTASVTETSPTGVLTDADLAKQFRSQADTMFKEAQRLRKQADDLDPPKKKATKEVSA